MQEETRINYVRALEEWRKVNSALSEERSARLQLEADTWRMETATRDTLAEKRQQDEAHTALEDALATRDLEIAKLQATIVETDDRVARV